VALLIPMVGVFVLGPIAVETYRVPTNAMAPAVWGRRKVVVCRKCEWLYHVSASDEVDSVRGGATRPDHEIVGGICPLCRYVTLDVPSSKARSKEPHKPLKVFRGDQFVAYKGLYCAPEPARWDVVVFNYPGNEEVSFVKRIVGLPHETVRIRHGDLFVKRDGEQEFHIARKPPAKVRAMLLPVHDSDYVPASIAQLGWPDQWQPKGNDQPGGWQTSAADRSFQVDGTFEGDVWLRYRHLVPTDSQWQELKQGRMPVDDPPQAQLIDDFFAGNTDISRGSVERGRGLPPERLGLHWVGDLAVGCTMEIRSESGEVVLELIEGGQRFQCRVDTATGSARLSIEGIDAFRPEASTPLQGPGTYVLLLANVDDQLLLGVDGTLVEFDVATAYGPLENGRPEKADLSPAGIGSRGASLLVRQVRLFRDVYYVADDGQQFARLSDFDHRSFAGGAGENVGRYLTDPELWDVLEKRRSLDFRLGADQFFLLGDNSTQSKDGRLWPLEGLPHYVERRQLIGKALLRYSPDMGFVR